MSDGQEEQPLDARQMAMLFLNSVVFIKIPLLFFGFRMSEDPTPFNVGGFILCVTIWVVSLTRFLLKKK